MVGGVARRLGRRSLAGERSLICAWSMVDMWPLRGNVSNQPGQLSLPSVRATAAAVCGLWRYTSVICLCLLAFHENTSCRLVCYSLMKFHYRDTTRQVVSSASRRLFADTCRLRLRLVLRNKCSWGTKSKRWNLALFVCIQFIANWSQTCRMGTCGSKRKRGWMDRKSWGCCYFCWSPGDDSDLYS